MNDEVWTEVDVAERLRLLTNGDVALGAANDIGSEQARRRIDRAVRKVRAYARRGAIQGFKVGRVWRFRPEDVVAAEARWATAGRPVDDKGVPVSAR